MIGGKLLTLFGEYFPASLLLNAWRFTASAFRRLSTVLPLKRGSSTPSSTAPNASPTRKRIRRNLPSGSSAAKSSTPKLRKSKERK